MAHQMNMADKSVSELQIKLEAAIQWKHELTDKRRSIQEGMELAQKGIAESSDMGSQHNGEQANLREQIRIYEENLKDIMSLVMTGVPDDKAGKRQLYDMIFK